MSGKNPAYKSINSSSTQFVEQPKLVKVLPPKNPAYKNVNSSSMVYVQPVETTPTGSVPIKKTWSQTCTIH